MKTYRAKSAHNALRTFAFARISRRPRGFTLAELMTVVVIVGILSAMAIPTFGGSMARNRVVAAGNRVAADLLFAAQTARQQAAPRGMNFDTTKKSYAALGINDADSPNSAYAADLSKEPYSITSMSADFGGSPNVLFDGYGIPSAAGMVQVSVGAYQVNITLAADGSPPAISGP